MAEARQDIISCPFCGSDVIRGSDTCDSCGRELSGTMDSETTLDIADSHFAVPLSSVRVSKATLILTSATVAEAVAAVAGDVGGAAIVLDGQKVAGIFTERDVLRKVAGANIDMSARVSDYMTADPVLLREDDLVATALHKMGSGNFRHIPLVRGDGQLVGVVTARDIMNWLLTRYFE